MADVVEVPLRRRDGTVRAVALIDAADAEMVMAHRWHLTTGGYVMRTVGRAGPKRRRYLMHREILGLERGDKREVDHIDHNPLNNCRSNLRAVAPAINQQNRKGANRGSSSRYRGVSWCKQTGRWLAHADADGRAHRLGRYDTEEEAGAVAAAFRAEHMPGSSDARLSQPVCMAGYVADSSNRLEDGHGCRDG